MGRTFDWLEDRTTPTTFTVTILGDTPVSGQTTLRQAIASANANNGPDTVNFQSGLSGTIVLGGTQLELTDTTGATTISGPGASTLAISGNNASRVLQIAANVTATIDGLTIRNGLISSGNGAGIENLGTLTIFSSVITANDASTGRAGGIMNWNSTLSINNSTISNNTAGSQGAAGIQNQGTSMVVSNCTISGNTTTGADGGILTFGPATIKCSTISGNSANLGNAGVSCLADVSFLNCTITGNRADADGNGTGTGGGITRFSNTVTLRNTIVAGNFRGTATTPDDVLGTLSAGSLNNIIGDSGTAGGLTNGTNGNFVGVGGVGVRPIATILNPILANNGGPTATHDLVWGSVAINNGTAVGGLTATDQRTAGYSRQIGTVDIGSIESALNMVVEVGTDVVDGNYTVGNLSLREAVNIANLIPGASTITFAPAVTGTIVLGGTRMTISGALTINGPGADKLAIDANNLSQIFYIDGRTNGSIDVTIAGLTMTKGKALGGGTIIDTFDSASYGGALLNDGANVQLRNFAVTNSSVQATFNGGGIYNWKNGSRLSLVDGTITSNSAGGGAGGGLLNWQSQVWMTNCTFSGNLADNGGGLYNIGGLITIQSSTISGNSATSYGGGIYSTGPMTVVSSTFSGNSAQIGGGGIDSSSPLSVFHSTFVANRADSDGNGSGTGGGIRTNNIAGATTTLINSIVAGNFLGTGTTPQDLGIVKNVEAASAGNLIGDPATAGGLTNSVNGNIVGKDNGSGGRTLLPANQVLDTTLKFNGGPTKTHALVFGGPAVGTAANANFEIARLGIASQSSSLGGDIAGFGPQFAIDGTTANNKFTHTDTANVNPTWQVDLQADYVMVQVVLSNRLDCCQGRLRDITVEVLNFANALVYASPLQNPNGSLGGPATLTITLPAGTTGRTLRVRRTSIAGAATNDNNVLSLSEVSIAGRPATDQRGGGFKRTEFGSIDIGAFEVRPALGSEIAGRNATTGAWQIAVSGSGGTVTNAAGPNWTAGVGWLDTSAADVNGDGWTDFVSRNPSTGVWQASVANGTGGFTNSNFGAWSVISWDDVRFGDFNGDGKTDVVGRWRETGQWWTGLSTGTSFKNTYWGQWSVAGPGLTWVDVNVGDLDGDGDTDFLGRWAETGNWYAGISGNNAMTNTYWGQWSSGTGVTWVDVRMGDLDGDGKADILGRWKETGQMWAGTSIGYAQQNVYWGNLTTGVTWVDARLADFDFDGRSDLMIRYQEAGQWYGVITDNSPFRSHNVLLGAWSAGATWVDVLAIDVDQDGKADLVGRDQQSGQWYVAKSNGTVLTTTAYTAWSNAVAWADTRTTRTR